MSSVQVSPLLLRCLHACLVGRGNASAQFLAEVRPRPPLASRGLYQPMDSVEVVRAIRLAYALAQDPALALQGGRDLPAHVLGLPGLLVAEAPTFRAALTLLERYWPLLCSQGRCALVTEGDHAHFVLDLASVSTNVRRFACEFAFAFLLQVGRSFVGRTASPNHVSFPDPAPDYVAQVAACFECDMHFDRARAEFVFPMEWLDVARAFADESLVEILTEEAEALLSRVRHVSPMRSRVYGLLMADPSLTEGDANALAKKLGISTSRMRRALQAEGETLIAIADEARIDRARSLLARSELTIKAISDQLGYSQPSAFHRAFKRKTGMSPLQFRRQDAS
ncbi:MAG: AraC family transcriptional regulator ligand-binding domain-containing protein [Myxococcales bacterium]